MRGLIIACILVSSVVSQQAPVAAVFDQLSNTVNDVSARTKELVDKTADDIRNKTEKVSHDVQKQVDETSTTIGSYISGIVRDVINFFKSLFGETNTPGQPALAPPEETEAQLSAPETITSSRYAEKAVYLSLLGMMVYYVLLSYERRPQMSKISTMNDCYRNLEECENFL